VPSCSPRFHTLEAEFHFFGGDISVDAQVSALARCLSRPCLHTLFYVSVVFRYSWVIVYGGVACGLGLVLGSQDLALVCRVCA
jgi:hypothetical protein